jgi:phage terminase large subunit
MQVTLYGSPQPTQRRFFMATNTHIAYGGARGGGKSWAMRRKLVLLAFRYAGLNILLLRRTLPELRENHINPLIKELAGVVSFLEKERAFIFPNGSRIKMGYCDNENDVLQYQGQEYDVIGLEEATHFTEFQRDFLTTCNRSTRTDFTPRMYYTANPGGVGHDWFKRIFIDKEYRKGENPEDYVFVPASVYDNDELIKTNPEYVQKLEALPEDLRRAHLDGDWNVFAGQFFREFSKGTHVVTPFEIPQQWTRFRSLDYGLDTTACYWWAIAPQGARISEFCDDVDVSGKVYIYRELHEPDLTLSDAAKSIVDLSPKTEQYAYTVASPDLWARRQDSGNSGVDILTKNGVYGLTKANNERVAGWRAMHEALKVSEDNGVRRRVTSPHDGAPWFQTTRANAENISFPQCKTHQSFVRVQIFENCVQLIKNLPRLQYDKNRPEDASDTPHEITHAAESMRYGVMSLPPVGGSNGMGTTRRTSRYGDIDEYNPMRIRKTR